jgi:uncharacterized membrane protein YfcA
MDTCLLVLLAFAIFTIAVLYAGVGHGGASGYIAVMALCALPPSVIKPSALVLNIVVSTVAFSLYAWAGHFRWRLFWPFAVTSIPASYLGGTMHLPPHVFKPILGLALLCAAGRVFLTIREEQARRGISPAAAMIAGAGIGLVSGMTGVGGGIFLSPLVLLMGWAGQRETSAVSALFILTNSIAGLAGHGSAAAIPDYVPVLAGAALLGGILGGACGSRIMSTTAIARALTAVVAIAGFKMIVT